MIHAHVNPCIRLEAEAPRWFIKLKRRDAEIQQDPLHLSNSNFCQFNGEFTEVCTQEGYPSAEIFETMRSKTEGILVNITSDEFS
jgi:hypothetical protein